VVCSCRLPTGSRRAEATEAELSAAHRVGRFSFEGVAGRRFESASPQGDWAIVTLAARVTRHGDSGERGARPQRPDRGELPGRFLLAGLRITPGPAWLRELSIAARGREPAVTVVRNNDTQWTLIFRLPASEKVELTGNLTQWRALSLTRKGEMWRVTVTAPGESITLPCGLMVSPGSHHPGSPEYRTDSAAWVPMSLQAGRAAVPLRVARSPLLFRHHSRGPTSAGCS
jgi:hypothetical protein